MPKLSITALGAILATDTGTIPYTYCLLLFLILLFLCRLPDPTISPGRRARKMAADAAATTAVGCPATSLGRCTPSRARGRATQDTARQDVQDVPPSHCGFRLPPPREMQPSPHPDELPSSSASPPFALHVKPSHPTCNLGSGAQKHSFYP